MQKGTNWTGNYSRFSFDETKQYLMVLKEKGVPILDDEINLMQEMSLTYLRRLTFATLGDGCFDLGFKIAERAGVANSFTITAGKAVRDGWMVGCAANTNYESQPISPAALTTPGSGRTDQVYLDVSYDEINGTEDASTKDPTLGVETACRLKLNWQVKVAEGTGVPADGNDANNTYHWRYWLATLQRTTSSMITAAMLTDKRRTIKVPTCDGNLQANLNADMVDGYQTNTAAVAATIPVRDVSAKVPGSITGDAVTVGGLTPGNASGNVPVSNTVRNIDLNADLLDGKHSSEFSQPGHTHPGTDVTSKVATAGAADTATDSDKLDGQHGAFYQNSSNQAAGTLPDARFPATLPTASGVNLSNVDADKLDGHHWSEIPTAWPIPVGGVTAFAGPLNKIPSGYLECSGVAIATAGYPALFSVIGYTYGGSGATFNLPDLRGEFIRGLDTGRGVETRALGSWQQDALQNIVGSFSSDDCSASGNGSTQVADGAFHSDLSGNWGYNNGGTGATTTFDASRVARTAAETRPRNIAMTYIIKT